MNNIFIFGYYGFKNLGDEAILASIIKTIKENDSSAHILALSYNVSYTEKIHRVTGVSRNNMIEVIKAIRASNLVISGGGSLLQDVTSSRSLVYYLALVLFAKLMSKPVLFYSNGFGPIRNRINKILTKEIVNKVDKIIVRDEDSKRAMEDIGISRPIKVTTDATFILGGTGSDRALEILKDEKIPTDSPFVGISVRPWYFKESFIEIMAKFADYLSDKGLAVLFIPMQMPKDLEVSNKIIKKMKRKAYVLEGDYIPEDVLAIIGKMQILIGMRLHALIFAGIQGIPMLGLEYDPKIPTFLKSVGQKNMGILDKLDLVNLCIEFDDLWSSREQYSQELKEMIKHNQEIANNNKEILKTMMD